MAIMSDTRLQTDNNGRQARGLFGPGNKFARGNPQHKRMAELRAAMLDAVDEGKVREIAAALCKMAMDGDVPAAKLVLEYVLGKPPQAIELSGPDGDPIGMDWGRMEAALLNALQPFGDQAKFAVAMALRGMVADAGRDE
jgi:hypothetical protein